MSAIIAIPAAQPEAETPPPPSDLEQIAAAVQTGINLATDQQRQETTATAEISRLSETISERFSTLISRMDQQETNLANLGLAVAELAAEEAEDNDGEGTSQAADGEVIDGAQVVREEAETQTPPATAAESEAPRKVPGRFGKILRKAILNT